MIVTCFHTERYVHSGWFLYHFRYANRSGIPSDTIGGPWTSFD